MCAYYAERVVLPCLWHTFPPPPSLITPYHQPSAPTPHSVRIPHAPVYFFVNFRLAVHALPASPKSIFSHLCVHRVPKPTPPSAQPMPALPLAPHAARLEEPGMNSNSQQARPIHACKYSLLANRHFGTSFIAYAVAFLFNNPKRFVFSTWDWAQAGCASTCLPPCTLAPFLPYATYNLEAAILTDFAPQSPSLPHVMCPWFHLPAPAFLPRTPAVLHLFYCAPLLLLRSICGTHAPNETTLPQSENVQGSRLRLLLGGLNTHCGVRRSFVALQGRAITPGTTACTPCKTSESFSSHRSEG